MGRLPRVEPPLLAGERSPHEVLVIVIDDATSKLLPTTTAPLSVSCSREPWAISRHAPPRVRR